MFYHHGLLLLFLVVVFFCDRGILQSLLLCHFLVLVNKVHLANVAWQEESHAEEQCCGDDGSLLW